MAEEPPPGAWRDSGSSGLFGYFGLFHLSGVRHETNKTNGANETNSLVLCSIVSRGESPLPLRVIPPNLPMD